MNNNIFAVKRLFENDIRTIEKCYADFDFLHFNPMSRHRAKDMLVQGQIWAVYNGRKITGMGYMLGADKPAFANLDRAWEIADLTDENLSDYIVAGYVWIDKDHRKQNITTALSKVWEIYRAKLNKKKLLHYVPRHIDFSMGELFKAGFCLYGLRGLDKLVPHYIFIKDVGFENFGYVIKDEKICSAGDTKQISKLCEQGFAGYETDGQNIKFTYRR